ncbi:unnamed protein product [Allacma fusca]|uniref:Uncharacterized protein n=1 Tax=Allacma fusca TaxID=39272 RepID=A0A8J2JXF3_9HEXA|nr:unnamed protein product [Allacma fusca]
MKLLVFTILLCLLADVLSEMAGPEQGELELTPAQDRGGMKKLKKLFKKMPHQHPRPPPILPPPPPVVIPMPYYVPSPSNVNIYNPPPAPVYVSPPPYYPPPYSPPAYPPPQYSPPSYGPPPY